jgi:hypothetical protein
MSEPNQERWLKIDLHIHSPASDCGKEGVCLLSILRRAVEKSLDVIGLVDHNSVRGYEQLRLEMSRLAVLKEAGRLSPEEEAVLAEYQQLLSRLLLLPGFELTAQEGVHLLALFPPETAAERLYALLLNLGIPMDRLREGSVDTHARADFQAACALISQAGGIVIAAHADAGRVLNPSAEAGGPAGLLALEVNALPEELPAAPLPYVWFSNAHCLQGRPEGFHPWGVGDRYTEVLLEDPSFEGLRGLLARGERERVRFPERERLRAHLERLRRQGPERLILCGEEVEPALAYRDVAALANAGGGVLLCGLQGEEIVGVADPETWSATLSRAVREQVDPGPRLNLELLRYGGKEVIRVEVHAEIPPPYMTAEGVIYVRRDGETRPATRAELLDLVATTAPGGVAPTGGLDLPQAGVEIVGAYLRDGAWFYDVRDLRVTSGVTRQRAKGLWAYAIERQEALRQGRADISQARWKGDRGIWRAYRSGERRVFDLVHRDASSRIDHLFYGVSEWGLTPRWREIVEALRPPLEEEAATSMEAETSEEREPLEGRPPRRPPATPTPEESPAVEAPPGEQALVESGAPEQALVEVALAEQAAPEVPRPEEPVPLAAPAAQEGLPVRPSSDAWGGHMPRWRGPGAVERVHWEGSTLLFDLAKREEGEQIRYYRRINRNQLAAAEGWVDLVRVPLPPTGVEVVRSTASGEEVLYQFRDMQTGRVDPRVRRQTDFSPDSPYAYAIRTFHEDTPLDENCVRWWGNIGYLRREGERVDLVYRDEEGRDHIYYAAERALLEGEWRELLRVWNEL